VEQRRASRSWTCDAHAAQHRRRRHLRLLLPAPVSHQSTGLSTPIEIFSWAWNHRLRFLRPPLLTCGHSDPTAPEQAIRPRARIRSMERGSP